MKPVLTFTDFIENKDGVMYSMELIATIEGRVIKGITLPVAAELADHAVLENLFRQALDKIFYHAGHVIAETRTDVMPVTGATLLDKLSMFEIKQTTQFNHDIADFRPGLNIITQAIW